MSLAPFAAQQARVNRAVLGRLADAVAEVGGGEPFGVLFDRPFADPFAGQVDASAPVCTGSAEALAGVERGSDIAIDGVAFKVERAEPDGAGFVRLTLYPVA